MKYEKHKLGSYDLNIISTTNFKTVRVEVKFRNIIKKEEITIRNLLKMVLLESTKKYNTDRNLVIKTEELYDLKLSSTNTRVGNYTTMSFNMTYLNEKYTEKNMQKKSLDLLMEILFNPNISLSGFDSFSFNACKNKIKKSIDSKKDNKTKYSIHGLLKNMGDGPYSYDLYGTYEDLDKITEASLYEYYKNMLQNDLVEIYVVGDIDSKEIVEYFKKSFKVNTFKKEKNSLLLEELTPRKRVKKVVEYEAVSQTKIAIGYIINNMTDYERKYVLHIYNEILGGSGASLLFNEVREKNSLTYYINSMPQGYDNILIVYTGIEKQNVDYGLKLIKKCIKDMENGAFTDTALKNAIKLVTTSVKLSNETPANIISQYYAMSILKSDDAKTRIEKFSKVTKEEVVTLASKIKLDTIFFLERGQNEEANHK